MDSRYRRSYLFNEAIFNHLLRDRPQREKADLKKLTFFQGSYFFSARPIEGLEKDNLPKLLLDGSTTGGETFQVNRMFHFIKPKCFTGLTPATLDNELAFDCKCLECPRKAFGSVESLLQHCRDAGHEPLYAKSDEDAQLADETLFKQYANVVLSRALSTRLSPWGKEFIDPQNFTEPRHKHTREPLGVILFRAFSCEFDYVRPKHATKVQLGLTVDLRAKLMRSTSLLDVICKGQRPNTAQFTDHDQRRLNDEWTGQVVIYKLDKKCYSVVCLRFDHSAESLPVEGLGMSHATYFAERKRSPLQFPRARPIVEVQGRRGENIFLPAELVCGNELDPSVREQLPLIASYTPKQRSDAVNEMMAFIGSEDQLLASCGIMLNRNKDDPSKARFLPAKATIMSAPTLIAAGVKVPEQYANNWTKGLTDAWYNAREPRQGVEFKCVVFYSHRLEEQKAVHVFHKIRGMVEDFGAQFRFEEQPHAMVNFRSSDGTC